MNSSLLPKYSAAQFLFQGSERCPTKLGAYAAVNLCPCFLLVLEVILCHSSSFLSALSADYPNDAIREAKSLPSPFGW
jgi:hypothetical protein